MLSFNRAASARSRRWRRWSQNRSTRRSTRMVRKIVRLSTTIMFTSSPPRPSLRHAVSDGLMGIGKGSEMEEIEREIDPTSGSHMPEPRQRIVSRPCWQFEVDYRDLDLTRTNYQVWGSRCAFWEFRDLDDTRCQVHGPAMNFTHY
jgi:hypothetical protein